MAKKYTLEETLTHRLREPNIAFLLGGGASFCAGLPGIFQMMDLVRPKLSNVTRSTFEEIIQFLTDNDIENPNIEEVLSELYYRLSGTGLKDHKRERFKVTFQEVCQCIQNILRVDDATEYHKDFMLRIVSRRETEPAKKAPSVQIFTTNYDLLIELACEESNIVVINGFEGFFSRRWKPSCFDYDIGKATTHTQTPRFEASARHIRLYKLHGSLSWFEDNGHFYEEKPALESKGTPLIIYPSRLKYAESIRPPFDWLFHRFNAVVSSTKLLVCIGYRFADKNINQYIFTGLDKGLSLLALSKEPLGALAHRSSHPQVSLINEEQTIIDGNDQNKVTDLWAFEKLAKWLPALKER
ncbi:MAG: SIR2 family protein [Candidatus Bathyarchaeota archaeon]|nr:MAG: SIR2 family protein [Candidatus Bathyarchaeota archaeon]